MAINKPMILFDAIANKWCVVGESISYTAQELSDKFNIINPILYCQQWREEHRNG